MSILRLVRHQKSILNARNLHLPPFNENQVEIPDIQDCRVCVCLSGPDRVILERALSDQKHDARTSRTTREERIDYLRALDRISDLELLFQPVRHHKFAFFKGASGVPYNYRRMTVATIVNVDGIFAKSNIV